MQWMLNYVQRKSGESGLVDRVLACTQEVEGSTPTGGTCANDFFRSSRPGYPHPVISELENSGIRAAVGDCSFTEHRRWRPPYQTGKTVHMLAKHYKDNEDRHTAAGVFAMVPYRLATRGTSLRELEYTHTYNHVHM